MIPVAILCGGRGTRLGELTANRPKSMVEVCGRPFVDWQLELLAAQGFTDVVLCVGHLAGDIAAHLYDRDPFVQYSFDGPEPLGTGGALKKAQPMLGEVFGVLYGDVYPLYSLVDVAEGFQQGGTMAVRAPGQRNVELCRGMVTNYDRAGTFDYGDAGFTVLHADELRFSPDNFDLGELYQYLAWEGLLEGHVVTEPVYEIGSLEGLRAFEGYVRKR